MIMCKSFYIHPKRPKKLKQIQWDSQRAPKPLTKPVIVPRCWLLTRKIGSCSKEGDVSAGNYINPETTADGHDNIKAKRFLGHNSIDS